MKTKSKAKLSSGVLQMKFMKRTAIETTVEVALEEQKKQIDDEHWYLSLEEKKLEINGPSVLIESGYSIFNNIGFGRMSFNGFNPQIEKLTDPEKAAKEQEKEEKEIDDDSMADHYQSTLHKTISNKFNKNKHQHKVKRI